MTWSLSPALDAIIKALRTSEVNPRSEQYLTENLADEENKADGTEYYYISMNGYCELDLQATITGSVTVTVEGTMQDDGTAAASITRWEDITNAVYGAANYTADAVLLDTNKIMGAFSYARVKVVCAGGGTDDYVIDSKRKQG